MNEDDQSTLNPIRTVLPLASAIQDGTVSMSFQNFDLQAYFFASCVITIPIHSIFELMILFLKVTWVILVILNSNIPLILFVMVSTILVIISGLIEGICDLCI